MIVKVCGLKNVDDAVFAVEQGATAIGINFYPPSPRFLSAAEAEPICEALSGRATRVGVFVGWPERPYPFLDVMQIHGLKPGSPIPGVLADQQIWVACSPGNAPHFSSHMVVIDTSWGSGQRADWSRLSDLRQSYILSGGLDSNNVGEALLQLRPVGVDVCSGVESRPGRKDRARIRSFLEAVREVT